MNQIQNILLDIGDYLDTRYMAWLDENTDAYVTRHFLMGCASMLALMLVGMMVVS